MSKKRRKGDAQTTFFLSCNLAEAGRIRQVPCFNCEYPLDYMRNKGKIFFEYMFTIIYSGVLTPK